MTQLLLLLTMALWQSAYGNNLNGKATLMHNDSDKVIPIPAFELPASAFLSEESRQAITWYRQSFEALGNQWLENCSPLESATAEAAVAIRQCQARLFYESDLYQRLLNRYPIDVQPETLGGVYCEVFTPKQGVSAQNADRVLINLHGGAFIYGSRMNSHLESVPIASVGKIKVISVDYRMAPGYRFPAATDDVVAVYKELLKQYASENIGLYGASAGAMLTSQTIARLIQENLPLPAAVGLFAAGAYYWRDGDSGPIGDALLGMKLPGLAEDPYFQNVEANNPAAFPGNVPEIMAQFPPALLISSSRDFCLSAVLQSHRQLVRQGVETTLHVWEGLDHVFFWNPELSETREMAEVTVAFFERHLAQ